MELETAIERIVLDREKWFVNFFNNAQPITPRMHSLELIPGIGKKYMWDILNSREKKLYESFEDLQSRVSVPSPAKLVVKRVIEELSSDPKYRLFTRSS
jgi:putative nucleotide binding protein